MPPRLVRAFVAKAPAALLANRYCDVAFSRFLSVACARGTEFRVFAPADFRACWLYYYCRTAAANMSQTTVPDAAFADAKLADARAVCPELKRENLAHFCGQWGSQLDLFAMIHATTVDEALPAEKFVFAGALHALKNLASIGYGIPFGGNVLLWLAARTVDGLVARGAAFGVCTVPPLATLETAAAALAAVPLRDQLRGVAAAGAADHADAPWPGKLDRIQAAVVRQAAALVQGARAAPPRAAGA